MKRLLFSHFFVECVVSNCNCKCSKFVTALIGLRDSLFSKKEHRFLISSKSMITNLNTGSMVNVTFFNFVMISKVCCCSSPVNNSGEYNPN